VPFGDLEPGQKLLVAVPAAPQSSRVLPAEAFRGAFSLELRFASPAEAESAARELCVAAMSEDSPGALLASDRPVCARLVGQGSR
jgi:hypothetical protein